MLLVTGITGHSGRHFLKELIDNKYVGPIRCIVRETSNTSLIDSSGLNIEKVIGTLDDVVFLETCMKNVDTIMHIAGIHRTCNVIQAAVRSKVEKVITVHTTGIYSKYKSASEEYKSIEQQVMMTIKDNAPEMGLIILRPTMIYGNINDKNMIVFIKMVDKLRLFPVIDHGMSFLQPVNGHDLGKAYYQVLINQGIMNGDYVLSGEKPITMLGTFKLISNILGKKTIFINIPLKFGVFLARILKIVTLDRIDYIEKVQRMGEDRSFPHEDAFRDFGYNPMSFAEGIKKEVKQYVEMIKS